MSGHPMSGAASAEYNQLVVMFNAGHHTGLETRARLLAKQHPDFGFAWKLLGVILRMLGKDCLPAMQKATELLPNDIEAHNNLGITLYELGQLDKAEASFRRAIHIRPDYVDAHFNLGNNLRSLGRLDEAETSYRRALKLNPYFAEVHCNLGSVILEQGRTDEAEASYRQALQIKPDYAVAHFNLGGVLQDTGHLDDAEASYRLALKSQPDYVEAYSNLGSILFDLGRLDEAEAICRQALQINPDFAEALGNLGNILLDKGHLNEAEACFRRALQIRPDLTEVRYSLPSIKKVTSGDVNMEALIQIEKAAQNSSTPLSDKEAMRLHFALGKSYDDTGDYEKAFPHFLKGNRIKRATLDYDANQTAELFAGIMRNFDEATLGRLRGGGNPSYLPIFILGMPRSGTTLTEQIIASHPEVHGGGELPDLSTVALRNIAGVPFMDNLGSIDHSMLAARGTEYVSRLLQLAPDSQRITDKMPTNFLVVGLIHLMLPNAKIIHVNRNPVDTCLSCFNTLFKHKNEHTYDLAELGRYYAGYARLMEYWRKILPSGAFLDVQYEDIVMDQEAQSHRLIEYCGLEWNDACLNFHQNKRSVSTASMVQVRQPMYKSSVERWRPYEKFLGPLFDALGDLARDRRE